MSSTGVFSLEDPSTASLIKDIVVSILRLLVLGLVIVVPQLDCLAWPFLKPPGVLGVEGLLGPDEILGPMPAVLIDNGKVELPFLAVNGEEGG